MTSTGHPLTARTDRTLEGLRPPALRARDRLGRVTAARRALPDLLIIGGQRCGTTSLYKALVQQPHVFRPVWRKGVHYFDVGHDHGPDWYRAHFPLRSTVERAGERWAARPLCFESSPYYMFHPLSALRIQETLPHVRVVVLVRDPIERAYSAHAHESARGYEDLPFAEALAAEEHRLLGEVERMLADPSYESHAHRHQAYRSRGEYAPQLERLADVFGRDRMKVIDSHRFFSEPEPVFTDLLDWLGTRQVAPVSFERHNARPRLPLADDLRRRLESHYEPYDAALGEWLGGTPSWRR